MVLSARIETYVKDAAFCSLSTTYCVWLIGQDTVATPHFGRSAHFAASRLFSRSASVIFIPVAVVSSVQLEASVTILLTGCITAELMRMAAAAESRGSFTVERKRQEHDEFRDLKVKESEC